MCIVQMNCEIAVIMREQASLKQKQLNVQRARWQIFDPIELLSSDAQWKALRCMSLELDARKKQVIADHQEYGSQQEAV